MPPKKSDEQRSMKDYTQGDLKAMEDRLTAAIRGVNEDIKGQIDICRKELEEVRGEVKDARGELEALSSSFKKDIDDLREETKDEIRLLREDVERLEFHQRKYNLIFSGVKAKRGEEETAIKKLLTETMGLPEPAFVNVHLIGKPVAAGDRRQTQSVIARFQRWEDRQAVLFNAKKLKDTVFGVKTDLPARLQSKREKLLLKRKDLKAAGTIIRVIERGRDVVLQTKTDVNQAWKTVE